MRGNDWSPNGERGRHGRGGKYKQIEWTKKEMAGEGIPTKKEANEEEWETVTQNNHS